MFQALVERLDFQTFMNTQEPEYAAVADVVIHADIKDGITQFRVRKEAPEEAAAG